MTLQDLAWLPRALYVNAIAGSVLTPRLLRYGIYRSAGIDTRSANIAERCRINGRGRVHIGRGTFVNHDLVVDAFTDVWIGERCAVAMQVTISTSTHEIDSNGVVAAEPTGRPVRIGDGCWIGARAVILPGVTIGDGAIVAAGSVVTRDCEAGGLYGGVPARKLRRGAVGDRSATPGAGDHPQP